MGRTTLVERQGHGQGHGTELRAPSGWGMLFEPSGFFELPRLAWRWPELTRRHPGDGSRVLVLPGFGADDRSTWPLRVFLSRLGYDARGWGFGRNDDDVPQLVERVGAAVERLVGPRRERLCLVGWSLGGYIAREVARDLPERVRRVVTLGSPVIGGPKYTTTARVLAGRGYDLDEIEAAVETRKRVPLRVPVTAIYSRRDGVVAWRACVDPENGAPIEHVEVRATHIGLGFSPEVYALVAERLARAATG